jgi:hypothetical protein
MLAGDNEVLAAGLPHHRSDQFDDLNPPSTNRLLGAPCLWG